MTPITTLSREGRGRIIERYDHAQRLLDETHAAVLSACGKDVRGESANALLLEMDRFADRTAEHRKLVGQLLDELTEES